MESVTRRRLLGGLTTCLAGTSGCATGRDGERGTDTATATEVSFARSVSEPASRRVRNAAGEPVVRSSVRTPEEDIFETAAGWRYEEWAVSTADDRAALEFAPGAEAADAARQFAAETDFSTATLLVQQYAVPDCRTRRLDLLEWRRVQRGDRAYTDVGLEYDEIDRSDCEGEGTASEATLVRIPEQVPPVTSVGTLVSGASDPP
jgi:hypothetical protein